MRKDSIKYIKINDEILKEVSKIIHNELNDPRISLMTTVVYVKITTDLKMCNIYISIIGGDDREKIDTIKGLNSAKGYIRRKLAYRINLRNTPDINFILDNTIDYGNYLSNYIDSICKNNC